jgi:hypothetical protein
LTAQPLNARANERLLDFTSIRRMRVGKDRRLQPPDTTFSHLEVQDPDKVAITGGGQEACRIKRRLGLA